MTDVFDPKKRSDIMSRIRSKNTKAELGVFSFLGKKKIYFQRHYKRAPGVPDIALPRKKLAVFIDGGFWHGKDLDKLIARRGKDDPYWVPKIIRNMERDAQNDLNLQESGWKILHVWEADILRKRTRDEALQKIAEFLSEKA